MLKKTFWKLIGKFDLHVTFLLDVFTCYYLFHNLLHIKGIYKLKDNSKCALLGELDNTQQMQSLYFDDLVIFHSIEAWERSKDSLRS